MTIIHPFIHKHKRCVTRLDDNCDDVFDTDAVDQLVWFADVDGDGFGDENETQEACQEPVGFVSNTDDCDDNACRCHPQAQEICNEIDDDCDSVDR